ncbi:MAG: class II fructose-bisphosphate aldolase [[Clostridium] scindens]
MQGPPVKKETGQATEDEDGLPRSPSPQIIDFEERRMNYGISNNQRKCFRRLTKEATRSPTFNVNNMEIVQGITEAAGELRSPVILQVSKGARAYAPTMLIWSNSVEWP